MCVVGTRSKDETQDSRFCPSPKKALKMDNDANGQDETRRSQGTLPARAPTTSVSNGGNGHDEIGRDRQGRKRRILSVGRTASENEGGVEGASSAKQTSRYAEAAVIPMEGGW